MKVALVHDWLNGMRGGEKCLELFCANLPADTPIHTLFHVPGSVSAAIESHPIRTSPLAARREIAKRYQRHLLSFPRAIESFDLSGYDVVLSSHHCVAKGVRTGPETKHLCYIFTPMRYIWDQVGNYFAGARRLLLPLAWPAIAHLRRWDKRTAAPVTRFVAISRYVAERVTRTYGRPADVVYPPVDVAGFPLAPEAGEHYVMVAADAAYKRVDLAVSAFSALKIPLVVVGKRQDENPLARTAPAHVTFRGFIPDAELKELVRTSRGFLLPCHEEFGIAAVEAMACGKPVVALGGGAALETVRGALPDSPLPTDPTGVFFAREDSHELERAVRHLESNRSAFVPEAIRAHAMSFDQSLFWPRIKAHVDEIAGGA